LSVRPDYRWVFCRLALLLLLLGALANAQATSERSFPQSKAVIEKTLKDLQANLSGRLPLLDGFANLAEHPFNRYRRAYFHSTVEVKSSAAGGSVVRVSTKVTAWYEDPNGKNSGYQLLTSNGRLEADLLDQLEDQLAKSAGPSTPTQTASAPPPHNSDQSKRATDAALSSPNASPDPIFSSSSRPTLPDRTTAQSPDQSNSEKNTNSLQSEYNGLQEILKNTAHPKNLVAVKKSGTPIVATPSLTAKPQFLASMHDEFELLDFNADWVHVRISGLSRGWIWRNSIEMPEGIADTDSNTTSPLSAAADVFRVSREEAAAFPGDWEPLRSQKVRIISVQKVDENSREAGTQARLEYVKFLFEKNYKEMAQKSPELRGVVVIFDSADGGMVAATTATLQQWIAGTLTDAAMWHKCFFDPPETFDSSGSPAAKLQ
jgi:hypothetical protein